MAAVDLQRKRPRIAPGPSYSSGVSRSLDRAEFHVLAVLDGDLVDDAVHVAGLVEFGRARGALVVDVLAGLDQLNGLLPLAGQDLLARGGGDVAQRLSEASAVGLAVLLDREREEESGVVGLRYVGVVLALVVLERGFVLVERGGAFAGVGAGAGREQMAVHGVGVDALEQVVTDHAVDADIGVEVAGLDGLLQD